MNEPLTPDERVELEMLRKFLAAYEIVYTQPETTTGEAGVMLMAENIRNRTKIDA